MKPIPLIMFIACLTQAMVEADDQAQTKTMNILGFAGQAYPPMLEVPKSLTQTHLRELVARHIGLPLFGFKLLVGTEFLRNPFARVDLSEVSSLTLTKVEIKDFSAFKAAFDFQLCRIERPYSPFNGNALLKIIKLSPEPLPVLEIECWADIPDSFVLPDPLEGFLDGLIVREVTFKIGARSINISSTSYSIIFSLDCLVYFCEANQYISQHPEEFTKTGSENIRMVPIEQTFIKVTTDCAPKFRVARERVKDILFQKIKGKYGIEIDPSLLP